MPGTTTFIQRGDVIDGDDAHRPVMPCPYVFGHSTFQGVVVFANVACERVAAMLTPGLTLARNSRHEDLHPVLHIAGLQDQIGSTFPGEPPITTTDRYSEFILLIPFVLHPQSSQWHNYVVRMYLDNDIARTLGELYGYRKLTGFFTLTVGHIRSLDVQDKDGNGVFVSTNDPIGASVSGAQAMATVPNFSEMVAILHMPVLGVDPQTGAVACSYFDLRFDGATVRRILSRFVYAHAFNPSNLAPEPRANALDGAIHVENLPWSLQFPPGSCTHQAPMP